MRVSESVESGNERATLRGHSGIALSVTFCPDGKTLVSGGGATGMVKLWDLSTLEEKMTLKGHEMPVTSLSFSPAGNTLATASYDRTVRLWRAATEAEVEAAME